MLLIFDCYKKAAVYVHEEVLSTLEVFTNIKGTDFQYFINMILHSDVANLLQH